MVNLLRAELHHMRKNGLFLQCLAFMSAGGVLLCLFNYQIDFRNNPEPMVGEQLLYVMVPMIGFVCAFWVSMFLGREYDYGTIRNKLIAGHSRRDTYLALTISCMAGCVLLTAALLIGSLVVSAAVMNTWRLTAALNGYFLLCTLLTAAVYGALFATLTLNCPGRAGAVCVCFGTMTAMVFAVTYTHTALTEPKLWMEEFEIINGRPVGNLVPNPNYVSGMKRSVYELIFDVLPVGQNIALNNIMLERYERWAALSLLMLSVVTVSGYPGFRRKDLR